MGFLLMTKAVFTTSGQPRCRGLRFLKPMNCPGPVPQIGARLSESGGSELELEVFSHFLGSWASYLLGRSVLVASKKDWTLLGSSTQEVSPDWRDGFAFGFPSPAKMGF